jgi:hypothetical protein
MALAVRLADHTLLADKQMQFRFVAHPAECPIRHSLRLMHAHAAWR